MSNLVVNLVVRVGLLLSALVVLARAAWAVVVYFSNGSDVGWEAVLFALVVAGSFGVTVLAVIWLAVFVVLVVAKAVRY